MLTIITHDNSMNQELSISEQLKRRRANLNLSLADVARRAGTSAATLSRYEHNWTRFETYTLRKLATALNCEFEITLRPKSDRTPTARTRSDAIAQLSRLFWDHTLTEDDIQKHPVWLVERVLEYGQLKDIDLVRSTMGKKAFLKATASAYRVSPRTRTFWKHMLNIEGITCTKKYSRNTAWNY